jgi:hypothetical protein
LIADGVDHGAVAIALTGARHSSVAGNRTTSRAGGCRGGLETDWNDVLKEEHAIGEPGIVLDQIAEEEVSS